MLVCTLMCMRNFVLCCTVERVSEQANGRRRRRRQGGGGGITLGVAEGAWLIGVVPFDICVGTRCMLTHARHCGPCIRCSGPYRKARSLRFSYRSMFDRLHQTYHVSQPTGQRKVMLMNCNSLCRIDLLPAFDGTFSEGAVCDHCCCCCLGRFV